MGHPRGRGRALRPDLPRPGRPRQFLAQHLPVLQMDDVIAQLACILRIVRDQNHRKLQASLQAVQLIAQGREDLLLRHTPPKDWSKSSSGGPRKMVKEEAKPV